jgi:methylglutaconyl-CoA hydratase
MTDSPVLWQLDARGVATVTFNRPAVNNAYNADLVAGVLTALDGLGAESSLRVVVIRGAGKHFQAGADLTWLNELAGRSPADNLAASRATAEAVHRLNNVPVPTVALIQGGCFGGGTGIAAASDVVIAADNAVFSIAETRWGLMAGIIIPQLNDAIGVRQVRRYALTGERFDAEEARRIGLAHVVVPLAELQAAAAERTRSQRPDQGRRNRARVGKFNRARLRAPARTACREASIPRSRRGASVLSGEATSRVVPNFVGIRDQGSGVSGLG